MHIYTNLQSDCSEKSIVLLYSMKMAPTAATMTPTTEPPSVDALPVYGAIGLEVGLAGMPAASVPDATPSGAVLAAAADSAALVAAAETAGAVVASAETAAGVAWNTPGVPLVVAIVTAGTVTTVVVVVVMVLSGIGPPTRGPVL